MPGDLFNKYVKYTENTHTFYECHKIACTKGIYGKSYSHALSFILATQLENIVCVKDLPHFSMLHNAAQKVAMPSVSIMYITVTWTVGNESR